MKGYVAINLFGFVFARKEYAPVSQRTIHHEKIHTKQMKELLYIFFYIWYGVEWLIRLLQYRKPHEAYAKDSDLEYLTKRRIFNFLKYITIKYA